MKAPSGTGVGSDDVVLGAAAPPEEPLLLAPLPPTAEVSAPPAPALLVAVVPEAPTPVPEVDAELSAALGVVRPVWVSAAVEPLVALELVETPGLNRELPLDACDPEPAPEEEPDVLEVLDAPTVPVVLAD